MRNRLSTQRSAPPTLGLRELATSAGNRIRGEAIKKGIHPYGQEGVVLERRSDRCVN